MYPTLVYVVEARRHGIDVLGPRINGPWISQPHGLVVQCGLRVLRGSINEATLQRIYDAARLRPFTGVADLCNRLDLSPADIERLIQAGTLDEFAPSRRHARWEAHFAYGHSQDQTSLLDAGSWSPPPILDAESPVERAAEEYATLGFTLSLDHPLSLVEDQLADLRLVQAVALRLYVGRRVQVAGVIVAGRRIHTASGRLMTFASLCDATGTIELTLFEAVAARYSDDLYEGGLIVAGGVVTEHPEHGTGIDVRMVRRVASLIAERPVAELDPELIP